MPLPIFEQLSNLHANLRRMLLLYSTGFPAYLHTRVLVGIENYGELKLYL